MRKRIRITVSGRVQGVGFRASAREKALSLGLVGWVRNLADGRVEILAEGSPASISALVEWCGHGPRWARVERLAAVDETPIGEFDGFTVR